MKTIEFESVTTKGGDKGFTSLFDGTRVPKNSPVILILGTIDILNAAIGITRASNELRKYDNNILEHIQNDLYDIMSIISGFPKEFTEDRIEYLERKEKLFMKFSKIPNVFINFGDNSPSAGLNGLRTSVRMVECTYLGMKPDPIILKYFNRLSDLFYVMSIVYENKSKKKKGMLSSFLEKIL